MTVTDSSQSAYEEALRLKGARRPAEAAAILQGLANTRLTLGVALNLGLCLFDLGRYAEAEPWILLAARNRPAEPATRQSLGVLYAAQGKVAEAELELRTALAFKPRAGHCWRRGPGSARTWSRRSIPAFPSGVASRWPASRS
jgi:Flp pilus assembly protein TadD